MSRLNGVIARFRTGTTYLVTRQVAGTFTEGVYADNGATSSFTIIASIQPVTGRALRSLPEGQHADETRLVFTETELQTRTLTHEPDELAIGGEVYQVISCEPWEHWGDTHYRAMVARRAIR